MLPRLPSPRRRNSRSALGLDVPEEAPDASNSRVPNIAGDPFQWNSGIKSAPMSAHHSDEFLSNALYRSPYKQFENCHAWAEYGRGSAPPEHIISKIPSEISLLDFAKRKPLFVRPRIFIQMISNVESQTFNANLFISATDADHNQTSSTAAFQARYDSVDANTLLNPTKLPPWHVNLLNAEQHVNMYREKNLPTIQYFPEQTFNGCTFPAHFFERQQVSGVFKSEFHLACFPFDKQILKIQLSLDCPLYIAQFDRCWLAANRIRGNDGKMKGYQISVDKSCSSALKMTEWETDEQDLFYTSYYKKPVAPLGNGSNTTADLNGSGQNKHSDYDVYSRITIVLPISRIHTHYGFIIFLPLALINLSSLFAFTSVAQDSLTLIATLMLAVFSLKLAFANIIPRLSYLSTMDKLFVWSYGYLFMCMVVLVFRKEKFVIDGYITLIKFLNDRAESLVLSEEITTSEIFTNLDPLMKLTIYFLLKISLFVALPMALWSVFWRVYNKYFSPTLYIDPSYLKGIIAGLYLLDHFTTWECGDLTHCLIKHQFCGLKAIYQGLFNNSHWLDLGNNVKATVCYALLISIILLCSYFEIFKKYSDRFIASLVSISSDTFKLILMQFQCLMKLEFHDLVLNFINFDYSISIISLIFVIFEFKYIVGIGSLISIFYSLCRTMVLYGICGLFRKRFDPREPNTSDIKLHLDADKEDSVPRQNNYSFLSNPVDLKSNNVRTFSTWIKDFCKKVYNFHLKEVFVASFYILMIELIANHTTNITNSVCSFMMPVHKIDVIKSNGYNNSDINACDYLYLTELFRIIVYLIVFSIWHICQDCWEHQSAFDKELREYKKSAQEQWDSIFQEVIER